MAKQPQGYIALDLGAESGRAVLAVLRGGRVTLEEAHRFINQPRQLPSGLHWDLLGLWGNLIEGVRRCGQLAAKRRVRLVSLGVDTWGVDFGLVGRSGQLLGLPFAYRDARNAPAMAKALRRLGVRRVYAATGTQFLPFNSIFQLLAQRDAEPEALTQARRMLLMPDLLHYFFTGTMVNEATIASTAQMINPRTGRPAVGLLRAAGLPTNLLGPLVPAGTPIGALRAQAAAEAGVRALQVITPAGHDTASAVAAVPVTEALMASGRWAYLSSGTWSLMGAELDRPLVTEAARKAGFTNEHGVAGKTRLLKNIAGLWLVQEVRRDLARSGKDYDYAQLAAMAATAAPFRTLVDPAHAPFAAPGDMPAKIRAFARATGQPRPRSPGELVRCCLESLALSYRDTLEALEALLGRQIEVLHIVGGGGHNQILNQMAADALGRPVLVGPFEATALGNALTQAIGSGHVSGLTELRAIVRASFKSVAFLPHDHAGFENQLPRFRQLLATPLRKG
jgi:rhamnulokinase